MKSDNVSWIDIKVDYYRSRHLWFFWSEKVNFAYYVSRLYDEKSAEDIFWKSMGFWKFWSFQKLENSNFHRRYVLRKSILLKAMKLEKIKYSKFYWFCYRSLHEKLLKDVFWQKWWLLKALKFEKFQKKKFSKVFESLETRKTFLKITLFIL